MDNFPASDYPRPSDRAIECLAKLLPGEIQRHFTPGPEPGEFSTRYYNATDLIQLLMETGIDVSEANAVHAIRWLVDQDYLIPLAVAVRDPEEYGLPTLEKPWLSAVLNGRLLDVIEQHGNPDPMDEHYIRRLEKAESEAYFATAAFWEWWRAGTPVVSDRDSEHVPESTESAEIEPAATSSKDKDKWWATSPPDSTKWYGPVSGTQKALLEALNASIDPAVTRKTLRQRHSSKAFFVLRLGNGHEWRLYFPTQKEFAEVNVACMRLRDSGSSEKGE